MDTKKRDRQPNWTAREELVYVDAYSRNADIIEGEFSGPGSGGSGITSKDKEAAWKSVQEAVNG